LVRFGRVRLGSRKAGRLEFTFSVRPLPDRLWLDFVCEPARYSG
jgi:hypothetical protein